MTNTTAPTQPTAESIIIDTLSGSTTTLEVAKTPGGRHRVIERDSNGGPDRRLTKDASKALATEALELLQARQAGIALAVSEAKAPPTPARTTKARPDREAKAVEPAEAARILRELLVSYLDKKGAEPAKAAQQERPFRHKGGRVYVRLNPLLAYLNSLSQAKSGGLGQQRKAVLAALEDLGLKRAPFSYKAADGRATSISYYSTSEDALGQGTSR